MPGISYLCIALHPIVFRSSRRRNRWVCKPPGREHPASARDLVDAPSLVLDTEFVPPHAVGSHRSTLGGASSDIKATAAAVFRIDLSQVVEPSGPLLVDLIGKLTQLLDRILDRSTRTGREDPGACPRGLLADRPAIDQAYAPAVFRALRGDRQADDASADDG